MRYAFGDILFASSGKKYAKNAAKTEVLEITEAPPAADEARRFPHQSPARTNTPADESPAARAYYARTASADTAILRRKLACMLS